MENLQAKYKLKYPSSKDINHHKVYQADINTIILYLSANVTICDKTTVWSKQTEVSFTFEKLYKSKCLGLKCHFKLN